MTKLVFIALLALLALSGCAAQLPAPGPDAVVVPIDFSEARNTYYLSPADQVVMVLPEGLFYVPTGDPISGCYQLNQPAAGDIYGTVTQVACQ